MWMRISAPGDRWNARLSFRLDSPTSRIRMRGLPGLRTQDIDDRIPLTGNAPIVSTVDPTEVGR